MAKIAFIGLGNMGEPMAINLINAGHTLKVFDLVKEPLLRVEKLGAAISPDCKKCVEDADFIISMLPAGKHVEDLYLGSGNLLAHISKKSLVIDCSTIDVKTSIKVSKAAEELGITMLDAPVSGGVNGAKQATLSFMVGCTKETFSLVETLLLKMGKNIFHAGALGAGQMAKECNNMLLGILMAGTAEALQLGIKNGLHPKTLSEIMLKSSGKNWALEVYNPCPNILEQVPSSSNYEGGFALDLMLKDMNLALQAARVSKMEIPLASLATELYEKHSLDGNGKKDFSSIFTAYEKK